MIRPLRILCVDIFGESALDWLLRCQADGHHVKWAMPRNDKTAPIGKGLVEKVDDYRMWADWADFLFCTDNVKYIRDLDHLRERGIKIIGPSQAAAAWELDRKLGMKILERQGVECPAYREFSDYDQAINYVRKEDRAFVSKPCGEETDKSLSYVAKGPDELIYMLQRWKRAGKLKGSFILQEKVDGICEMGVGAWFGPGGFSEGYEENWETKKLMPGDLGVNTGEMGTTMRFVRKSKLGKIMLDPLADELDRIGYVGCIDVNCIIDAKGQAWPLEFTMRPGWPAFTIQQALHNGDHAEWLYDLAAGHDAKCFRYDEVAVGVVEAIGHFPHSHALQKEVVGVPIYGMSPALDEHIHPCMVMQGSAPVLSESKITDEPMWVTAGDYVLVSTGTGDSVRDAARRAYQHLKRLTIPASPIYRNDIGKRLMKELPAIQEFGYAAGMAY